MKDNDKIDDFVGKISEISSKFAALGKAIEEPRLVKKFLSRLPRKNTFILWLPWNKLLTLRLRVLKIL